MSRLRGQELTATYAPSVDVRGSGAQSLLWLHGFMGSSREFLPFASALSATHTSLLVDLPGHGGSPLTSVVSFECWADVLLRVLDSNGIESTDIVGYSMGGRLALYFSVMHPDRVRRVVLESASPGLRDTRSRRIRAEEDDRRSELLRSGELASFVASWYQSPIFSNLKGKPGLLDQLKQTRGANDKLALADVLSKLSPGRQPPMWRHLPSLSPPVLMLSGAMDAKFRNLSRRACAASRVIRSSTIPGAGHNIHLESPKAYLEAVRRFLRYRLGHVESKSESSSD